VSKKQKARRTTSLILSLTLLLAVVPAMFAPSAFANGTVTYSGQGFTNDGTTYSLNDQRCGTEQGANDGGTGQFADWNGTGQAYQTGQPYMVWVLTANGATSATLNLPDGSVGMIQVGGTFKYASHYYNAEDIIDVVTAEWIGKAKGRVQLTVSHGCPPGSGGWCSPGFWRNASDGAWERAGFPDKAAGMATVFNGNVTTGYYETDNPDATLTIGTVLTDVGGAGGANKYGAADDPHGLNAFNAVGAFLTDQLTGGFDPNKVGVEGACQIDHHGVYK
jgi:hypothetical protein